VGLTRPNPAGLIRRIVNLTNQIFGKNKNLTEPIFGKTTIRQIMIRRIFIAPNFSIQVLPETKVNLSIKMVGAHRCDGSGILWYFKRLRAQYMFLFIQLYHETHFFSRYTMVSQNRVIHARIFPVGKSVQKMNYSMLYTPSYFLEPSS